MTGFSELSLTEYIWWLLVARSTDGPRPLGRNDTRHDPLVFRWGRGHFNCATGRVLDKSKVFVKRPSIRSYRFFLRHLLASKFIHDCIIPRAHAWGAYDAIQLLRHALHVFRLCRFLFVEFCFRRFPTVYPSTCKFFNFSCKLPWVLRHHPNFVNNTQTRSRACL